MCCYDPTGPVRFPVRPFTGLEQLDVPSSIAFSPCKLEIFFYKFSSLNFLQDTELTIPVSVTMPAQAYEH